MLIDKVCGLNEMELNMKNENQNLKRKKKIGNRNGNDKSSYNFQNVFEQEIKEEKYK